MTDNYKKALNMIGLATKAGKTVTGDEGCKISIRRKTARLVIFANDASENTKNSIIKSCVNNNVKYLQFAIKDELGQFTGKSNRAIVAITQEGFAKTIRELIEKEI